MSEKKKNNSLLLTIKNKFRSYLNLLEFLTQLSSNIPEAKSIPFACHPRFVGDPFDGHGRIKSTKAGLGSKKKNGPAVEKFRGRKKIRFFGGFFPELF